MFTLRTESGSYSHPVQKFCPVGGIPVTMANYFDEGKYMDLTLFKGINRTIPDDALAAYGAVDRYICHSDNIHELSQTAMAHPPKEPSTPGHPS